LASRKSGGASQAGASARAGNAGEQHSDKRGFIARGEIITLRQLPELS
jgi:hypothetical protein